MKIEFLGVGPQSASMAVGHSNLMMTSSSGKRLVIDFGMTAPFIIRDELGIPFTDIDAIYISHAHADHAGGLEMFAFDRYFTVDRVPPKLYLIPELQKELWNWTLKGGMDTLYGRSMKLKDYFELPNMKSGQFTWEGYHFVAVPTVHMVSGYKIKHSYGLYVERDGPKPYTPFNSEVEQYGRPSFLFTSDTTFVPSILGPFYEKADMIFHECETYKGFKSNVHTHYNDLLTLPDEIRSKMFLYHYKDELDTWKRDGFAGFAHKGDSYKL